MSDLGAPDRTSQKTTAKSAAAGTAVTTTVPLRGAGTRVAPKRAAKRPATKPRRSEPRKFGYVLKLINGTLTFLLVVSLAIGGGLWHLHSSLDVPGPLREARIVAVPKNDGTLNIAERLEREGVIANRYTFLISYWMLGRLAAWNNGKPVQLKAGDYELKQAASLRGVIDTLSEGRTVMTRVTVPEGLTSYQIVERLKADPALSGDIKDIPPEGSLLPETYSLPRGSSRQQVIELMQAAQKKLIDQLWQERQPTLPISSPAEAITLASIVEKETGKNDERERVAAVFVNRLRQNMQLQSDPTILYGLFLGKVSWGKPILASEIRSNTAHNTYVIKGLPPTPICNPGRAAIEATLKPAQTKELYFVADGKGGHLFAETLKDHNANVARWRQIEKDMQQQKQAAPAAQPTVQPTTLNAKQPAGSAAAAPAAPQPAAPAKKN